MVHLDGVGTKTKFRQEPVATVGRGSSEPHPSGDGKPVEMVSDSDRPDGVGAASVKQETLSGDREESPGFSRGEDVNLDLDTEGEDFASWGERF